VFDRPRQTISAPGCYNVFANADARGYYFTEYTPEQVRALARSAAGLKPVERISLLGDEWWIVRAGRHDIGVYLDLAAPLAGDETAAVLETMAPRLSLTGEYIASGAQHPRYEAWIRQRFGPVLEALGLPGSLRDADEQQSRRAELLTLVGVTGNDAGVQRRARELAERYVADPSSLSGTLAPTVLRVGAVPGDARLYDQYVAQLDKLSAQPEEYYRFFNALTWFRDPALVTRTLQFALTPAVRTQDTGTLIAGLIGRPWARDAAWEFTKAQWPALVQKLGTFQGIPTIIGSLGAFCSTEKAAEVKEFFAKNPVPSSERALQQAVERIDTCAALVARQSPALTTWLQSNAQ
jgi:aminopeptidase N